MSGNPTRPLRTLLVDQSEVVLAGVATWAAGRPDLVIIGTARNGPDAIEAVERLEPDLVLIDAILPELDGLHVVAEIKTRPNPPLVVVATLLADATMRNEALVAGADGFVPKDDFIGAFELLLAELAKEVEKPAGSLRTRTRSSRRESRIARDP